jgi:hypothetical protein
MRRFRQDFIQLNVRVTKSFDMKSEGRVPLASSRFQHFRTSIVEFPLRTSKVFACSEVRYNCSTVQCSTVQCNTVQYSAIQYSAIQYSAVQCSAM